MIGAHGRWLAGLVLILVAGLASPAGAHELRPALLVMQASGDSTLATLQWESIHAAPELVVPESCPRTLVAARPGHHVWRIDCELDEVLQGSRLELTPLINDAVLRVDRGDEVTTRAMGPHEPSLMPASTPRRSFLVLGVEHILGGFDHLLFVLGLVLVMLPDGQQPIPFRRMALAITSFTVAHSVTLALSALELVHLPQGGVEAAIAASLVLLGLEALSDEETWTRRHPHAVAFAFGLLHGFGFAGALREIGLPGGELVWALLTFNLGVELGQVVFLGAILVLLAGVRRLARPELWFQAAVYLVGGLGTFWLLQRGAPLITGVFG